MSIIKDIFGPADNKVVSDTGAGVRSKLNDWTTSQVGQAGPTYTGQTTAPASQYENQSFDFLRKYGQGDIGTNPMFQNASNEVNKTLTNQYDPTTSPYYQAVKAGAERNLGETQRNIASNAAGGGRYFTGARLKEQGRAATDTGINLDTMLGQMSQQERQNRLNVLPQAMSMAQAQQNQPLQQAQAFQSLGALPRQLQQNQDTTAMNNWFTSNYDYPMQMGNMANNVMGQQPTVMQQNPNFMQTLTQGAGKMLPQLAMMAMMGGL